MHICCSFSKIIVIVVVIDVLRESMVWILPGVLLSMSGFGQFIGACIAWWFTSYRLYLTASEDSLDTGKS